MRLSHGIIFTFELMFIDPSDAVFIFRSQKKLDATAVSSAMKKVPRIWKACLGFWHEFVILSL